MKEKLNQNIQETVDGFLELIVQMREESLDDVTHSTKEPLDGAVETTAHSVNFDNCHLAFCDVTIPDCRAIFRMRHGHAFVWSFPSV